MCRRREMKLDLDFSAHHFYFGCGSLDIGLSIRRVILAVSCWLCSPCRRPVEISQIIPSPGDFNIFFSRFDRSSTGGKREEKKNPQRLVDAHQTDVFDSRPRRHSRVTIFLILLKDIFHER